MSKTIEELAEKLGARVLGTAPDYSAGVFGAATLAGVLRTRFALLTEAIEPGRFLKRSRTKSGRGRGRRDEG